MSKNDLRITIGRGPIWGIHSLNSKGKESFGNFGIPHKVVIFSTNSSLKFSENSNRKFLSNVKRPQLRIQISSIDKPFRLKLQVSLFR